MYICIYGKSNKRIISKCECGGFLVVVLVLLNEGWQEEREENEVFLLLSLQSARQTRGGSSPNQHL
ncbi:hypothetical protein WG66_015677 [Moniliophthora roreri]|nr:hypothetical protein WG66_015677 [Moniliophthora roreri]